MTIKNKKEIRAGESTRRKLKSEAVDVTAKIPDRTSLQRHSLLERRMGDHDCLSVFPNNNINNDNNDIGTQSDMILHPARPFLTNLSVRYDVRKSGIGSALAERGEREVVKRWNQYEIVLEVEEDNERALEFYKKRGYEIVFVDPTGRRYDVSGLWLQQKRCKRYVMRKELTSSPVEMATEEVKSALERGIEALFRLRETVFQGKSIKLL